MMNPIKRIRFQGSEFLLVDGAIGTREAYTEGRCSFAHLFPDGKILRFGKQIGTINDIEFLGEEDDVVHSPDFFANVLSGDWEEQRRQNNQC